MIAKINDFDFLVFAFIILAVIIIGLGEYLLWRERRQRFYQIGDRVRVRFDEIQKLADFLTVQPQQLFNNTGTIQSQLWPRRHYFFIDHAIPEYIIKFDRPIHDDVTIIQVAHHYVEKI